MISETRVICSCCGFVMTDERHLHNCEDELRLKLASLTKKTRAFTDDVLPQLSKVVLQDYENLNELQIELRKNEDFLNNNP